MTPIEFLRRQKEEKENPKNIAKISNALVEALVQKSNLGALKIVFYISKSNIELPKSDLMTITIDTTHLCNYCDIDVKTLRRNINRMQETNVTFVEKDVYEESIVVIPYFKFNYGGTIEIKMFSKILKLIREVKNRFTMIDVENLMKLKSKHSVRMILLLEMISGFSENVAKRKHYSLAELNGMFGTNYPRLKEFERNILIPVQKELNNKSKLSFIYEVKFDKEDITAPGRPKAVGVIIDLIKKEALNRKRDKDKAFLEWVNKIRKEHVNEILLYHPEVKANLRVSPQGNLYWDNGNALNASKAKEFWNWMYSNVDKLMIRVS